MNQRETWSSKIGFILAVTGAAVGLGNLWKFPYMVGSHGGSAFLVLYIISVFIVGIPLMLAEMVLGRLGRPSIYGTLKVLKKRYAISARWQGLVWLCMLTLMLIFSFYNVVAGWSLSYLYQSLTGNLAVSSDAIHQQWQGLLQSPVQLIICHLLFLVMTLGVVWYGIQKGIERLSRWMMPILLVVLIGLVGMAMQTSGFEQALSFLFDFRWQSVTPAVACSALGHAFFTLAVGAGCMLNYGAHLPKHDQLLSCIAVIIFLDVMVAMLAGLAIFPWVMSQSIQITSGPGLMFQALPLAFAHVDIGYLLAPFFFLLLWFAALTSSVSLAEPLVAFLMDYFGISRSSAIYLLGVIIAMISTFLALSFNVFQSFSIFGLDGFTCVTDLATNWLLPLGGLGFAYLSGWKLPLAAWQQALAGSLPCIVQCWYRLLKWVAPLAIIIILSQSLI
jgi:NSS family neurotransmitter:Na+ symporter